MLQGIFKPTEVNIIYQKHDYKNDYKKTNVGSLDPTILLVILIKFLNYSN